MDILAFGDPHGFIPPNLNKIIKNYNIKLIVCTGDIAPAPVIPKKGETFEEACKRAEKSFKLFIDTIASLALPVLTLRGNVYVGSRKNNKITKRIFSPHKNLIHKPIGKFNVNGQEIILFDMVYEKHSHPKLSDIWTNKEKNQNKQKKLNRLLKNSKNVILISHAPPFGYLDRVPSGANVGSKILLESIKRYRPMLVLCGHIHEGEGRSRIGKTEVINLGEKKYQIIEVKDNKIKILLKGGTQKRLKQ